MLIEVYFLLLQSKLFGNLLSRAAYSICESSFLSHHGVYHDVFVFHNDSLTS